MGPEIWDPSPLVVKLAWSQFMAASNFFESMLFRMGKTRHATSVIEAPAPSSRIAKTAAGGMKDASLEKMERAPSSSSWEIWCAEESKSRGLIL